MTLREWTETLRGAAAARSDVDLSWHPVVHRSGAWELPRVASAGRPAGAVGMLVRAGVHGDERSGPLTFARHVGRIFDYAHERGVGLCCYPLGNPSGFDRGLRYNADHDKGPAGNNDFLRYELDGGTLRDSIGVDEPFRRFLWSSDPSLDLALPAETRVMHELLRREPLGSLRAALDLHQDHLTPRAPSGAYHYAFGDLDVYASIVERVAAACPLLACTAIGAGFGTVIDAEGRVVGVPAADRSMTSDASGFIVRHDGTLSDLLYRLGVRHSVAPETTGATPMEQAIGVNLAWIEGLIDLVAP